MGLCEGAKGGIVLESDLPKTRGFHTLAETTAVGYYNAFLDHCHPKEWILRCSNRFAQFMSDWHYVEDGSSADQRDAWNIHGVKQRYSQSCSDTIIVLKSRDGLGDDLRLRVAKTGFTRVLLYHHKDGTSRALN